MYWLDTDESWNWWAECWKFIFEAAGVRAGDRIYFAFSFGPFIGFWAGWEGARKLGVAGDFRRRAIHRPATQSDH